MLKASPVSEENPAHSRDHHIYDDPATYLKKCCVTLNATKKTLDRFATQKQFIKSTLEYQLDIIEKMIEAVVEYRDHINGIDDLKFKELLSYLRSTRTDIGRAIELLEPDRKPPQKYYSLLNSAISKLENFLKKHDKK